MCRCLIPLAWVVLMNSPWVELEEDLTVESWEFVCPMCNLVKPKHLAATLGRYVVCEVCGE